MANRIIRRKDALAQGLTRYFTGKPCRKSGHIAERFTCNGDCVVCSPIKHKRFGWWKKNPERHREQGKKARAKKSYKQWRKEYTARWLAENPDYNKNRWHSLSIEERRRRKKKWYEANRQHAIEYMYQWTRENPEQARELSAAVARRRRARQHKAGGNHTAKDAKAILIAQKFLCANVRCKTDLRKVKRHLDHIVPISKGGSNDKANVQWLCQPCNNRKHNKLNWKG